MLLKKTLLAAAALVFIGVAFAGVSPATATFQVKMKVTKDCSVVAGSGSNIDFGSQDSSATNLTGTSNISVTCAKNTPYFIGLAPANSNSAGAGVMLAQNTLPVTGNTDTVAYQLRSTAGMAGTVWGNTATGTVVGNGVAGTGNGSAQTIPVFATVPSANVTADDYLDTVTINVNF